MKKNNETVSLKHIKDSEKAEKIFFEKLANQFEVNTKMLGKDSIRKTDVLSGQTSYLKMLKTIFKSIFLKGYKNVKNKYGVQEIYGVLGNLYLGASFYANEGKEDVSINISQRKEDLVQIAKLKSELDELLQQAKEISKDIVFKEKQVKELKNNEVIKTSLQTINSVDSKEYDRYSDEIKSLNKEIGLQKLNYQEKINQVSIKKVEINNVSLALANKMVDVNIDLSKWVEEKGAKFQKELDEELAEYKEKYEQQKKEVPFKVENQGDLNGLREGIVHFQNKNERLKVQVETIEENQVVLYNKYAQEKEKIIEDYNQINENKFNEVNVEVSDILVRESIVGEQLDKEKNKLASQYKEQINEINNNVTLVVHEYISKIKENETACKNRLNELKTDYESEMTKLNQEASILKDKINGIKASNYIEDLQDDIIESIQMKEIELDKLESTYDEKINAEKNRREDYVNKISELKKYGINTKVIPLEEKVIKLDSQIESEYKILEALNKKRNIMVKQHIGESLQLMQETLSSNRNEFDESANNSLNNTQQKVVQVNNTYEQEMNGISKEICTVLKNIEKNKASKEKFLNEIVSKNVLLNTKYEIADDADCDNYNYTIQKIENDYQRDLVAITTRNENFVQVSLQKIEKLKTEYQKQRDLVKNETDFSPYASKLAIIEKEIKNKTKEYDNAVNAENAQLEADKKALNNDKNVKLDNSTKQVVQKVAEYRMKAKEYDDKFEAEKEKNDQEIIEINDKLSTYIENQNEKSKQEIEVLYQLYLKYNGKMESEKTDLLNEIDANNQAIEELRNKILNISERIYVLNSSINMDYMEKEKEVKKKTGKKVKEFIDNASKLYNDEMRK